VGFEHDKFADLNLRTTTGLGLRIPIIDRMQATVQFNLDRNNSPASDAKKNDYDTLITGGYTW